MKMQKPILKALAKFNRRYFCKLCTQALVASVGLIVAKVYPQPTTRKLGPIKIGACDWSLGASASTKAFWIAKTIGLDGVQISLGTQADNLHLRRAEVQDEFMKVSKETKVAIASLAIGELNRVPFKSEPITIEWVADAIDTAKRLSCSVILLAFFGEGDLRNDLAGQKEVIRRLKELAPIAERNKVFLAIESWLSAKEHLNIIDAIGSPAIRVYYDVANAWEMGYPVPEEIRLLGLKGLICEMHMKENQGLLGTGKVDFNAVRLAMEDINYKGWVQIEGSQPKEMSIVEAYKKNLSFLRSLFT